MSYIKAGYRIYSKIEEILKRKSFKTIFITIFSFILFFGIMNVYAQEETPKISPDWEGIKNYYNLASGVDADEDNMTSHAGNTFLNTSWVILSTLAPDITVGGDEINASSTIPLDMKGGVLGFAQRAYAYVYVNQPRIDVLAHLKNEWVPGADISINSLYAAENKSGYDSLFDAGISPLWAQFRNIAYLFFVVIMIVIGFMIMFRSKIGGQMMVTIGNVIPNVVISLIMITFSFAIAGIIIDIGGLLVSLLYSILDGKSVAISNINQFYKMFSGGVLTQFWEITKNNFTRDLQEMFSSPIKALVDIVLHAKGTVLVGLFGSILMILGSGIVLVGAIKLLITLYKSYFEIILNVIISPLKILIGTLPGNSAMRINWIIGIMRNVLVFPIAYFIVNIPIYLAGAGDMVFNIPEKLTGANLVNTGAGLSVDIKDSYFGLLLTFILKIFVLFYASQAPKFAEVILPVKETNRAMSDAMAGARMSMSKVPLVGGLFK